jgi:hypothetical protein
LTAPTQGPSIATQNQHQVLESLVTTPDGRQPERGNNPLLTVLEQKPCQFQASAELFNIFTLLSVAFIVYRETT